MVQRSATSAVPVSLARSLVPSTKARSCGAPQPRLAPARRYRARPAGSRSSPTAAPGSLQRGEQAASSDRWKSSAPARRQPAARRRCRHRTRRFRGRWRAGSGAARICGSASAAAACRAAPFPLAQRNLSRSRMTASQASERRLGQRARIVGRHVQAGTGHKLSHDREDNHPFAGAVEVWRPLRTKGRSTGWRETRTPCSGMESRHKFGLKSRIFVVYRIFSDRFFAYGGYRTEY